MKTGKPGWNYDSEVGCSSPADPKLSPKLSADDAMGNPKDLDPNKPKPSSQNPGKDMGFWGKANPQTDTTGWGKLTRSCCD